MGQCACTEETSPQVPPASPTVVRDARTASSPRGERPVASPRGNSSGSHKTLLLGSLSVVSDQATSVSQAPPRPFKHQQHSARSASTPQDNVLPPTTHQRQKSSVSSFTSLLQFQIDSFCRMTLSSMPLHDDGGDTSATSIARLVNAVETCVTSTRRSRAAADVSCRRNNDAMQYLSSEVLGHHVSVYPALFAMLKSGSFHVPNVSTPASPPTVSSTQTFRIAAGGAASSHRSAVSDPSARDVSMFASYPPLASTELVAATNVIARVHVSRSILSYYFLRPIAVLVCLAAEKVNCPSVALSGAGLGGTRTSAANTSNLFASGRFEDPLSLGNVGNSEAPLGDSQSTSRCSSPSPQQRSSSVLAKGAVAEYTSDDEAGGEEALFARLQQWAVSAASLPIHRRRQRRQSSFKRSELDKESSVGDVDALVGLAGKGYRCKEPTDKERAERLTRGIAKARLSGVADVGVPSKRSKRSKHHQGVHDVTHQLTEVDCLTFPSQKQHHPLITDPGHPSSTSASAPQEPPTEEPPRAVDDIEFNLSAFLSSECFDGIQHRLNKAQLQSQSTSTPGAGIASSSAAGDTAMRPTTATSSEPPSTTTAACLLHSQFSLSHASTDDRWEAAMCLDAHQFSREAGESYRISGGSDRSGAMSFLRSEPQQVALIGLAAQRGILMHACCEMIAQAPTKGAGTTTDEAFEILRGSIPTAVLPPLAHLQPSVQLDAPCSPRSGGGNSFSLPPMGFDVVAPLCGSLPQSYAHLLLLPSMTPLLECSGISMGLRMLLMYSGYLCLPLRHRRRDEGSSISTASHLGSSVHPPPPSGCEPEPQVCADPLLPPVGGGTKRALRNMTEHSGSSVACSEVPSSTGPDNETPQRASRTSLHFTSSTSGGTTDAGSPRAAQQAGCAEHVPWHRDEEMLLWLIIQFRVNSDPQQIVESV